jgi:outer membrane autotransporter protein
VQLAALGSAPSDRPAIYAQAAASPPASGNSGRGFWINGGASRGNARSDGNASGFDWRAQMVAAGVDMENDHGTVLGAAFAYGNSDIMVEGGSRATVKSPRAAIYGKAEVGNWQLRGAAGYANQEIRSQRAIDLAGVTSTASGSHRGREWSATGEAEFGIALGSSQLKPLAGFRYVNLKEAAYTETGSIADLTISAATHSSKQSLLGARYVRPIDGGVGSLEVRAIWAHEFGESVPTVTGHFATALSPATFTVAGVPIKRDALVLGAGISDRVTSRLSLYGDLAAELRAGGQSQYGILAGMRYAW